MSRHTSPTRLSKKEYADGLEQQIGELQRRRREQPSYVSGKIGSPMASYDGKAGPAPAPPTDRNTGARARANGRRPVDDLRESRESLAHALEQQIQEKNARQKAEKERARQASRDRIHGHQSSPDPRRQGRAWVPLNGASGYQPDTSSGPNAPGLVQSISMAAGDYKPPAAVQARSPPPPPADAEEPEWMRSTDDVSMLPYGGQHPAPQRDGPIPSAGSPVHGRRSSAKQLRDSSNSPLRGEKSFSGRHVSPERLRENAFELRSERKLFDFDKRESFEEERRRAAARQQEELAAALRAQIEERERKKALERQREEELDRIMEQRARDEAAAMAAAERAREEALTKHAEEAEEVNKDIARRRHSVASASSPQPARSRAPSVAHSVDAFTSPQQESPQRAPSASPSMHLQSSAAHQHGESDVAVSREDLRQVLESLQEIRAELARGPPLQDASPPQHLSGAPLGDRQPISYGTGPDAPSHAPFVARDAASDEAHRILERNRQRLAALRHANKHDDILRAFLLQDSTAAMRTVTDLHAGHRAYPAGGSYQSWGSPSPHKDASPAQQRRSHTSMY